MKILSWAAALAAGAALMVAPVSRANVKPGDAFPALADANLSGGQLPDLAGKVVMVDFCASWCAPCKASFPTYSKLQTDFGPRGFVIVAVSVDDDPSKYQAFVKKMHPAFTVLRDGTQQLVAKVNVPAMPTSYLLGRDGKVLAVHVGYHSGSTEKELRSDIERALTQPAS